TAPWVAAITRDRARPTDADATTTCLSAFPEAHTTVGTADSSLHGWAEWLRWGDDVSNPCERPTVPGRSLPVAHTTLCSTPAAQPEVCSRSGVWRAVGPGVVTHPGGLREPAHARRNPP